MHFIYLYIYIYIYIYIKHGGGVDLTSPPLARFSSIGCKREAESPKSPAATTTVMPAALASRKDAGRVTEASRQRKVATTDGGSLGGVPPNESQSKPGTKMAHPEPCKELRRRPQLLMVGIVPYYPSSTRVLIVTQMELGPLRIKGNKKETFQEGSRDFPLKDHPTGTH